MSKPEAVNVQNGPVTVDVPVAGVAPAATPVSARERIAFVDILRGFAVLGILLVNMLSFAGLPSSLTPGISALDRWTVLLLEFLVRAKFYSLFSFLFGWGMAIQMLRAEARGVRFVPIYVRRLVILLAFGVIHGALIWTGDILTLYALLGFLLLLFRRRSPRFLLLATVAFLALALFLNMPGAAPNYVRTTYTEWTAPLRWTTHPESVYANGTWLEIQARRWQDYVTLNSWSLFFLGNVFAMFLLGLYVGRRRIFEDIETHIPLLKRVLVVGGLIGVVGNGIFIQTAVWNFSGWPEAIDPAYYRFVRVGSRTIAAPALMLFYVAALILLSRTARWRPTLAPLAPVGRMALTNYLAHSVILTLVFYNYGLGLYGRLGVFTSVLLSLLLFAAQIRFSAWWLNRYRFGPVEWLWRTLTYGRRQPLARGGDGEGQAPAWLRRLRQVNPTRALLLSWLVLLLWGGSLWVWYASLGIGQMEELPELVGTNEDALAGLRIDGETETETEAAAETGVYEPPRLRPARYEPSALVLDGDMVGLVDAFAVDAALAQLAVLSDDQFAGRYAGSPGGWAAGDYIAEQFAALGLQPAGDDDTYFQPFALDSETLAAAPRLTLHHADGTAVDYQPFADFAPVAAAFIGAGQSSGRVVWANDCAREDFDNLDVLGAVVFCRGVGHVRFTTEARNALEHGAAGLLLLADVGVRPLDFGPTYFQAWVPEPLPAFRVGPAVAADLLAGSGRSLEELSYNFTSFPLETTVDMRLATSGAAGCATDPCQGRNVLGVLPGRNPDFVDEVVIIGGHYDHLGAAPDGGLVWDGANDNASGIAVLLEIARTWHENGFVPQRTVLFAAWDGEEMGLLGSRHYVDHPRFLLEDTVAALQLDMVGAGPATLHIDGDSSLVPTVELAAAQLGITTTLTTIGRSDHAPFLAADVPANLLTWFDGGDELAHYHRPEDTMAVIQPDRVAAAGRVAALTLLGVAEGVPQIETMLAARAQAVAAGAESAFLATTAPAEWADSAAWWAAAADLAPTDFVIEIDSLHAAGREAVVEVTYILTTGTGDDKTSISLETSGRLRQVNGAWLWAGPDLAGYPGPGAFTVRAPAVVHHTLGDFNAPLSRQYEAWANLLGVTPAPAPRISFYATSRQLRADTDFSLAPDTSVWVGPGHMKLVYANEVTQSARINQAVAQLLLADAGIAPDDVPWLWEGLPPALAALTEREDVYAEHLSDLAAELADDEADVASHWAAVTHLRRQIGWEGVGAFIADLGQSCAQAVCDVDGALARSVGLDGAAFADAWRAAWMSDLAAAQAALDDLLTARAAAALAGDMTAWLAPVDDTVPGLIADQRAWLVDLTGSSPASVSLSGRPETLYDDGSMQARVTSHYATAAGVEGSQTALIQLRRDGADLLWAGAPAQRLSAGGVTVLYPAGAQQLAAELAPLAGSLITDVATLLDQPPLSGLVLRLYPNAADLRLTASPLLANSDWVDGWTAVDGTVQLGLIEVGEADVDLLPIYEARLVELIARRYLYDQGVTDQWLLTGLPLYVAEELGYTAAVDPYIARLPGVVSGLEHERLASLADWTAPWHLAEVDALVVTAQAWDSLRYLADSQGEATLLALAAAQAGGRQREGAMAAVATPLAEFEPGWIESLNRGHAQPASFTLMDGFDVDRALAHVAALTDPALAGRQAGSPGAWAAAEYVATEFAALGLTPVGADGDYFQRFDISYAELTATPLLQFTPAGATAPVQFLYREEFMILLAETGGFGSGGGQLIWINDGTYDGIDLAGNIVIREPEEDYLTEMERAVAHGAGGLILIDESLNADEELLTKPALPVTFATEPVIPVVVLTRDGFDRFLDVTGTTPVTFDQAGAALPLASTAQVVVPLTTPAPGQSANVLGLLPGADPVLRDEIIIVGAHYDFVGDDPDLIVCDGLAVTDPARADDAGCQRLPGFAYSGANDNASGVAALLELARLWTTGSYGPGRTILFAAWGAQEAGELGSRHYVSQPVFPLADTVGMVQLDGVGGGEGFRVMAEGWRDDVGAFLFGMEAATTYFNDRLQTAVPDTRSDHFPFLEAGVPAMLVSWVDARDLNLPDIEADPVLPERLQLTSQLIGIAIMIVAR